MENLYKPPASAVDDIYSTDNNSGGGSDVIPPDGVKGWSWGAFMFGWLWAIFNKTWIGLLTLVPYIGFLVSIYLGVKGRELAWRNKRWDDLDHFQRVQKRWSAWGVGFIVIAILGIVAAIAIPAYQDYNKRAHSEIRMDQQ